MIKIANNIHRLLEKQAADKEDSLHDWFSRKGAKGSEGGWVDCNSPDGSGGYKTCGREKGESRSKYPACRPTAAACKDKGKGDSWGKKSEEEKDKADDACTRKVKARYDVWPSAYASGAVTRCRAVGAANWGEGESKKDAADKWLGAAKGLIIGGIGGKLLGGAMPDSLEKPRLGITAGEWNTGASTPAGILGALLGGGLGYAMTDGSDDKKTKKQKKKTEKKAYGAADTHSSKKKANTFGSDAIVDAPIKCTPGFGCKRYLTPQETLEVEAAKERMFPSLVITDADPISSQLSSPGWAGAGYGLLGALLGSGVGAGVGKVTGSNMPLSALLGGALGGLGAGLYGYGSKSIKNKQIEDLMQDLPVGADLGDVAVFSDPQLKAQLARDFQRQLIRKGLMGRPGLGYQ